MASRLGLIVGGLLFLVAGIITLFSGNWQGALFLFAIGAGLVIYYLRE